MRFKSIYLILLLTLIEWRIGDFKSIRTTTTTVESDSVAATMTTIENSLNKLWHYKYQHHLFANPATMSRFNTNNTFSIMSDESASEEKEDEIDQDEEDDGDNNPDSSKYLFYPDYSRFDPKTNSVKHYFYHNNNRYPFSLLDLEENASSLELLTNNRNKNNNNIFQYLQQQQQQQQTTAAVFTTSSSFQQQSSIGGGSSSPTNHYQVITICNTLPSILKCQNRQHYLIIYKVIYGINDLKYQSECSLNTKCMQVDEKDEQNCTGSNICVFYPVEKQLVKCNFIKSNLTQIQIACVNLSHLKKYYIQRNKKFDQKAFDQNIGDGESVVSSPSSSNNSNNNSKSTTVKSKVNLSSSKKIGSSNLSNLNLEYLRKRQNATANLTASSSGNSGGGFIENRSKTSLHLDYSNTNQNSVIAISLITFFSLLAVILISLIYYRLKIKQLITASGLGVSSSEERTTPTTTSSINGGANTTGAVAAAANSAAATNHQQLCSTIGTTGTSTTISSSTQNTLTKSLPPPPPGFESSTNNSAQATLEKEAAVEADEKKKTSKKEEKEEIIVSDKPLSSHQKQEVKKAEEKNEQTISQEQNSNQNPTVQASGLVTHLRQQLNNLHSHLKKYNSSSSSSSSQQAVKSLKPQQPKSMNDCSKQKHAGKSTSCVIPLGEGESSGKANSNPNPSAASVQKPVLTVTDAEDYYPSMNRTKQENSKIYNIDESSAIQQQQPKSRTLTSTTEIYANLSMRSKSNTSMSSKLTEATAAVVAANRGSIKSSIKKNKKAIAAVAAAKAAAAAAGDKDSKLKGRSDNSDYYQIVSNAVSKVANGNGTNKKIKHSEKEPRSVVNNNNNNNTNNSKSSSKPTAQTNTSSSPKKENPTTKNTITSSSHYENSSIVSNSMSNMSNGGVEINNNGDYNTSTTLTGGLNNGINGSSSSSTSNMSLSSSSLSSTVAAASSASSSAATSSLSTAATAAGSLSSAVTSSAATNELYYQRSSVAGFNFTYMLYDIPEEEDEDNQTDRDVSNCDEILKI